MDGPLLIFIYNTIERNKLSIHGWIQSNILNRRKSQIHHRNKQIMEFLGKFVHLSAGIADLTSSSISKIRIYEKFGFKRPCKVLQLQTQKK